MPTKIMEYIQKSQFRLQRELEREEKRSERVAKVVSLALAAVIFYAYFTVAFK